MRHIDQLVQASALLRRDTGADLPAIAEHLEIPEGWLLAAHASEAPMRPQSVSATPLRPDWAAIVEATATLGPMCAVTGNGACVQRECGFYRSASHRGPVGMVLGGCIDLRLLYPAWTQGFAVREPGATGARRSLQFFDAAGRAVHKACLLPGGDVFAFEALAARFADTPSLPPFAGARNAPDVGRGGMGGGQGRVAAAAAEPDEPSARVDAEAVRRAWACLTDAEAFVCLLRRFGLTRIQAFRLAGPRFARRVGRGCASLLLEAAASLGVPLKILVGNAGAMQVHAGPVRRVERYDATVRVRDPGFQMRLDEERVHSAWVVRKPTADGMRTSLELFDAEGRSIAVLSGRCGPGRREPAEWRDLVASLRPEPLPIPVG